MKNRVLRVVLNLITAVSLAVSPLGSVLGAVDAGKDTPALYKNGDSCHSGSVLKQPASGAQESARPAGPCPDCDDNCYCSDTGACVHPHTVSPAVLPTEFPASSWPARDAFVDLLPGNRIGLRVPPNTPPPIA